MSAQPRSNETDWTIGRLLSWTSAYLAENGIEESRLASEVLLAHATTCRRIDLYTRFDVVPPQDEVSRFRGWVQRAGRREPIAYLVGEKEFFSLSMTVTPDVLIPRPETETLVELVLDHCRDSGLSKPAILDLGTGSGCIAVAVLTQLRGARVVGSDVSEAALAVAVENAERHGVADRFSAVRADGLALADEAVPPDGFDLIVSNPPYVAADALDTLDKMVRNYEPTIALTDRSDGLSFYRWLAKEGPQRLSSGGVVIVEVGDDQAEPVTEVMQSSGMFEHRKTRTDRVVGQARVLMFSLI